MLHCDARDWIRGTKPWEQFLIYCDRLGREQGTDLWAAYLTDERMFEQYKQLLAERDPGEEQRPSLFGYDRVAEGLHALQVEIGLLHRSMSRNLAYPLAKGPVFPAERFAMEADAIEVDELLTDIDAGMRRGEGL